MIVARQMREMSVSEPLWKHRNTRDDIKTEASTLLREEYGGYLLTGHTMSGVQEA